MKLFRQQGFRRMMSSAPSSLSYDMSSNYDMASDYDSQYGWSTGNDQFASTSGSSSFASQILAIMLLFLVL